MPIPASHIALWLAGSLVRGAIRKYPYRVAAAGAGAAGLGLYKSFRKRSVRKQPPFRRVPWKATPMETPRYPAAKRQRRSSGAGGSVDVVAQPGVGAYANDTFIKKRRTLGRVNIRKLARAGVSAIYDRWQQMQAYGVSKGSMSLDRLGPTLTQTGLELERHYACPMYLWDLTAFKNTINGAVVVPQVAWQLVQYVSPVGTNPKSYRWNPIISQNISTGQPGTDLQGMSYQEYFTPKTVANEAGDLPLDACLLDWVKVQGVFWGSKKHSHKIHIEIVQMARELAPASYGQPSPFNLALGASSLVPDDTQNERWYANWTARSMEHPYSDWDKEVKKYQIKVLARRTIEFSPVASFEENGSADAHKTSLNEFIKMGRKCDLAWQGAGGELVNVPVNAGELAVNDPVTTMINRGRHSNFVHPNARVYLRIWSDAYYDGTAPDRCASFDLRITRKYLVSD